jgi:hypothetical protein
VDLVVQTSSEGAASAAWPGHGTCMADGSRIDRDAVAAAHVGSEQSPISADSAGGN